MDIRDWVLSKHELRKTPMSMGVEFLVSMILSWIATHWVSPDTRLGAVAVFFGVLFALIFAYGFLGYARRQWRPQPEVFSQKAEARLPIVEKAKLTPYEIDQKLSKIDNLLEFLRSSQVAAVESGGNEIRRNPWGLTKSIGTAFVERCADYRHDVDSLTNRIEQIRSTNAHHPDIIAVLPKQNDMGEFANAVSYYGRAIETMAKYSVAEADFLALLEPRDDALRWQIIKFAQWRGSAMNTLMNLRRSISP